jgi:Asp-tRNA(Asn)/Glu-tRNA(Gln) amidotransferase A subunit family amidase
MTSDLRPALRSYLAERASFAAGTRTPRQFLEACIERLEWWEPRIAAFVQLDLAFARAAADASTQRWREGRPLSAIDGMPIGIKDIIETAHLPTQMGSPLFAGWRSERDAASVAALREAGAAIVGKTVTTEFAATEPGATRNPWDTTRTPGGSSSGSAAAVGAGILPGALGTQVIGSIIRPAGYCGCVGYKPSVGSLNRGGSMDHLSQSAAGALGASLEDAWAIARAISERVGGDPGYPGLSGPLEAPPARAPQTIAVLQTAGWDRASAAARAELMRAVELCRTAGARIVDRSNDRAVADVEEAIAGAMPLSRTINTWESRWPLNTLARDRDRNGLSLTMQERLDAAERMTPDEYRHVLVERRRVRDVFERLQPACDVVMTLSAGDVAPVGIQSTGDPTFAVPSSLLGVPALSLPALQIAGLPLGLQLIGFKDEDAALFEIAAWVRERVT